MPELKNAPSNWKQTCRRRLRDYFVTEFSCRGLGFNHTRPSDFVDSQWLWVKPWMFVIYRSLLAVGLLIWISLDIPREIRNYYGGRTYIWFLYATNWAFGFFTLTAFLLTVFVLVYNFPRTEEARIILYQPIWFLYNISVNTIIVACLVFWIVLANSEWGMFTSPLGRLKHSLTAILALLDVCISAIPVRLVHSVYPLILGVIYSIFTYVFWVSGGMGPFRVGQIYLEMNWSHPGSTVLACLCACIVSFFVHVFIYLVYIGRVKLSVYVKGRNFQPANATGKAGYGELGTTSGDDGENPDDLISVASMSTCVEAKMSRDYGAVE